MNLIKANITAKKLVQEVWADTKKFEKNYSKIIKILRKALSKEPNNISTLTNLGAALCDTGSHQEASKYLFKAFELGSKDKNTYFNLGVALINSYTHEDAMKYFKMAKDLKPSAETWEVYFDPMAH